MTDYAFLPQRGIIEISGADTAEFLQGLVTNDMRQAEAGRGVYTCFLTPQGKYLADFFVTKKDNLWLLDIDRTLIADVVKRFTMFKLRSRVMIADTGDKYKIYAVRGDNAPSGSAIAFVDPRCDGLGWRVISAAELPVNSIFDYETWRLEKGLPDTTDFERERSTMAETNMDLLNAVSFDKGCYIGQELTARVEHRGLVKKRLHVLRFDSLPALNWGDAVTQDGQTVGLLRSHKNDLAMALLSLDAVKDGAVFAVNGHTAAAIPQ